jgi:hypothetical protein
MSRHWIPPVSLVIGGWAAWFVPIQGLAVRRTGSTSLRRGKGFGEEASYSRQTIEGIRFPSDFSACPERWPDVAAEIALWAWKGGSIIGVGECRSKYRGNMLDKVMMCHKCRPYKSESAQQASSPLHRHSYLPFPNNNRRTSIL